MEERFWAKVKKETEERDPGLGPCWTWTGRIGEDGYGYFMTGDRVTEKGHRAPTQAHIVSTRIHNKPISDDYEWDHFCRTRHCVNPSHLEAVPHRENIKRGLSIVADFMDARTYKCGHPKDSEHTYYRPDGKGQFCGTCSRAKLKAKYQARKKSA
jgi:hypothetical protein